MAKRYRSYAERIARAKTEKKQLQLLKEAESMYGKSYYDEYMELMTKAEKRKEDPDAVPGRL